eukprot:3214642-Pleurochrysis_carterae.AAC.1
MSWVGKAVPLRRPCPAPAVLAANKQRAASPSVHAQLKRTSNSSRKSPIAPASEAHCRAQAVVSPGKECEQTHAKERSLMLEARRPLLAGWSQVDCEDAQSAATQLATARKRKVLVNKSTLHPEKLIRKQKVVCFREWKAIAIEKSLEGRRHCLSRALYQRISLLRRFHQWCNCVCEQLWVSPLLSAANYVSVRSKKKRTLCCLRRLLACRRRGPHWRVVCRLASRHWLLRWRTYAVSWASIPARAAVEVARCRLALRRWESRAQRSRPRHGASLYVQHPVVLGTHSSASFSSPVGGTHTVRSRTVVATSPEFRRLRSVAEAMPCTFAA